MAATKKKSARARRRQSASSAPKDYWRHNARPLRFGDERFRATIINPAKSGHGTDSIVTTDQVQDFSWDDTTAELTGSLTFQALPVHIDIGQRSKVRMEWAPSLRAKMERLFTMKVAAPDRNMVSDVWALDLTTSLTQARSSQDDYRFKADKRHPHGWTADEVARYVCNKVGIPVGRIAKCTHRITNLVKKGADPIDMIVLAYRAERRATGRRFFMSWDGALNVDPLKRPEHLLELSNAIIDASYKSEYKDSFATSLTVRGTTKKIVKDKSKSKHRRQKFHVNVSSPSGVRAYGYVHRTIDAPDAKTEAEARKFGKQVLAKNMKPQRTLTVTVPLMPTVRRGQAFKVQWKAEGLTQIVFVAAASHSVAAGQMTTQLTATFDDPFKDAQAEIDRARRKAAARKRKRGATEDKAPKGPTSRRGSRRRSAH